MDTRKISIALYYVTVSFVRYELSIRYVSIIKRKFDAYSHVKMDTRRIS